MGHTLGEYLLSVKSKRIAVVGIGVSNTPLIKRLLEAGISVTACDRKDPDELGDLFQELQELGATLQLGEGYLDHLDQDIIFRSPGIRPDIPAFEAARVRGSLITSEMEVFFQVCPCRIIAVTGSDGKTTTTTLISEMLKHAGYTVHVGGNIGTPLLAQADRIRPEDIAVLELSSFQLMTFSQSPQIAVVTNVSPNHLDWHRDMDEYRRVKENIFLHQTEHDLAVFNQDHEETAALALQAKGQKIFFSRSPLEYGVYVENGTVVLSDEGGKRPLFPVSDILIPGEHNVENYLAAIAAVKNLVSVDVMLHTAKTFAGVEHRIELVRTLDHVRYYNDSIASSPTRTIAGLHAFPHKVILIAGGYDKKIPFDDLGVEICNHVKTAILTGHTAGKIQKAILEAAKKGEPLPEIVMASDFSEAVQAAHRSAEPGDVVILSPACASFDAFSNFAERGNTFKRMIHAL